jgi:mannose-6-phosphate isomerase
MKLSKRSVEKVWGRTALPPPFSRDLDEPVGEIWFEPPPAYDALLIKYLFTSEKLSVQTHPADGQAGEGVRGKDECWLVLDAEPDARLAIGFSKPIKADAMRVAALDGSIEHLLEWHPAKPGDFFYLPANTVHAIGPGLTLVEVQQNTDITYRLFDYGRPRELHLEEGMAVAKGEPYRDKHRQQVSPLENVCLVDGPYFRLDQCSVELGAAQREAHSGGALVLPIDGHIACGGDTVRAGQRISLRQSGS